MTTTGLLATKLAIFVSTIMRIAAVLCKATGSKHSEDDSGWTNGEFALELAIKKGRLDKVKEIIQSSSYDHKRINTEHPNQDLYIIWLVIFSGNFEILLYFVQEAHKYGLPEIDFGCSNLIKTAEKSSYEIRRYFNAMSILQGAGVNPAQVTCDIIDATKKNNMASDLPAI